MNVTWTSALASGALLACGAVLAAAPAQAAPLRPDISAGTCHEGSVLYFQVGSKGYREFKCINGRTQATGRYLPTSSVGTGLPCSPEGAGAIKPAPGISFRAWVCEQGTWAPKS